jgi:hypothetical protein
LVRVGRFLIDGAVGEGIIPILSDHVSVYAAAQPTMRREHTQREAVPVASHAERSLSNARRTVTRRAKRQ